jgi:hypothetical protein
LTVPPLATRDPGDALRKWFVDPGVGASHRAGRRARLAGMADDDAYEPDEEVKRRRRTHRRSATTHERAARIERQAAEASEIFGESGEAEGHREAARRQEARADEEHHDANRKR